MTTGGGSTACPARQNVLAYKNIRDYSPSVHLLKTKRFTKLFFSETTPLIEHISHKYIPLRLLVLSMDDLLNALPATIKNAIQKQTKKTRVIYRLRLRSP